MNEQTEKKTLFEDDAFKPVPESERHGWWKTSFIWAGHGDRNGSSDPDPVPGGTLPVESAETEKRIKKDMKSSGTFKE